MSLLEIVRIPVAPDSADALVAVILDAEHGYLAPPYCVRREVFQSADRDHVVAVILWASEDAHETAANSEVARTFFGLVTRNANGDPRIESLVSTPDPAR
ncbi:putative quinol monooxygenase [Streptomyces sp. NPDC057199]|uniref:putative quinol monooxygenase n=1 Tax=Streptomyces sp. NPDC057199 TaxID=3346047 RepID=UPI0036429B76